LYNTGQHKVRFAGQGHTYTCSTGPSLPTRQHKVRFASQGHTCTHTAQVPAYKRSGMYMSTHSTGPCLQDRTKSGSPVRDIYVHTQHPCLQDSTKSGLPSGYVHVHTQHRPCLQDRTKSGSPVRDVHVHTQHRSLPTKSHEVRFPGQRHT